MVFIGFMIVLVILALWCIMYLLDTAGECFLINHRLCDVIILSIYIGLRVFGLLLCVLFIPSIVLLLGMILYRISFT